MPIPSLVRCFRALCASAVRQRWRFNSSARKCSFQLLSPVRNVAGRPIAVNHLQGSVPGVCQLMKNTGRNIDGLSAHNGGTFGAEAHFARALQHKIDLFLFLVVPWNLAPFGLKSDISKREVPRLYGARAANDILREPSGRVGTSFDGGQ